MKRKEMLYAVIGGCFGAVLTLIVGLFTPMSVVAKSQPTDAEFDKITCREIEVVNNAGKTVIKLYDTGDGGNVVAYNSAGKSCVSLGMGTNKYGGYVSVQGVDGEIGKKTGVQLAAGKLTGSVTVWGRDRRGSASMSTDKHGGGVIVFGRDGEPGALMNTNKHGGRVTVFNVNKQLQTRAAMSVNEDNNGVVSTWDKDGKRTDTNNE